MPLIPWASHVIQWLRQSVADNMRMGRIMQFARQPALTTSSAGSRHSPRLDRSSLAAEFARTDPTLHGRRAGGGRGSGRAAGGGVLVSVRRCAAGRGNRVEGVGERAVFGGAGVLRPGCVVPCKSQGRVSLLTVLNKHDRRGHRSERALAVGKTKRVVVRRLEEDAWGQDHHRHAYGSKWIHQ